INDDFISRPYTPTNPINKNEDKGILKFIIKIYEKGLFTQYLEKLKIGEIIKCKGPVGHIIYHGLGIFTVNNSSMKINKISMVAGGTGITPLIQLIKNIIYNSKDKTQIKLLYANHSIDDIILKDDLDDISKNFIQFSIEYTISKLPKGNKWNHFIGRVNESMINEFLFTPSSDTIALCCGPPTLIEKGVLPNFINFGYIDDYIFEF
ncbi:ferredoxin reductase-like protein, partial [Lichtheimia hyalospora FSU 10163]